VARGLTQVGRARGAANVRTLAFEAPRWCYRLSCCPLMLPRALRHSLALCLASAALGCAASDPSPDASATEECSVTAPSECSEPELRYSNVAPIFEKHCSVCHSGVVGGPWPLDRYPDIADWADIVRDELVRCSMPPPGPASTLSNQDRLQILNWLRCGLPE